MEDLIRDIQERTGLPTETVLEVVTLVTDYMRRALPDDLVEQITSYLGVATESAGSATDSARATTAAAAGAAAAGAAGLVDTAAGMASSAFSIAKDTISNLTPDDSADDASDN